MGNEESQMVSAAPTVLESRTMEGLAKYIKEHKVTKIAVMVSYEIREAI